jgi:hypothetical protein
MMQGLHVFPCWFDKSPAVAGGFKSATNNPAVIELWQKRYFLFGAPTGAVNGFDVLDVDPRHGGDKWLASQDLPETRVHATRSDGRHYLFKHHSGLVCSASTIAPGVDIRTTGGYVIWWPWTGCKVLSDAPIAAWPGSMLELIHEARQTPITPIFAVSPVAISKGDRLVPKPLYNKIVETMRGWPGLDQRRVRGILRPLVLAREGGNFLLYRAASQFRDLIKAEIITRADAEELLLMAATLNGYVENRGKDHAWSSIKSGLDGKRQTTSDTARGGF